MLDNIHKLLCANYKVQKRPSLSADNSSKGLIKTTCTFLSKILCLTFYSPSYLTLFFIICLLTTLCRSQADRAEGATGYFGILTQTHSEG